jgi:hypothetical protein
MQQKTDMSAPLAELDAVSKTRDDDPTIAWAVSVDHGVGIFSMARRTLNRSGENCALARRRQHLNRRRRPTSGGGYAWRMRSATLLSVNERRKQSGKEHGAWRNLIVTVEEVGDQVRRGGCSLRRLEYVISSLIEEVCHREQER